MVLALGLLGPPRALATTATYIVNVTADDVDSSGCQQPSQPFPFRDCTLREAIAAANAHHPGSPGEIDLIKFKPTLTQINVGSALPALAEGTEVCGDCDASSRHMILNGPGVSPVIDGLSVTGDGSIIRGMQIQNFGGDGVEVNANQVGFFDDRLIDNFKNGLHIAGGGNASVGGNADGQGNEISGNGLSTVDDGQRNGIRIDGGSGGNVIHSNLIGTNESGSATLQNREQGIEVLNVNGNTIGGFGPNDRNVISGNGRNGIYLDGTASGNSIFGNLIGTDRSGTADLGNLNSGVLVDAPGNTIGTPGHSTGVCDGNCNVISGNGVDGVFVSTTNASDQIIQGNFIGTNLAGTARLGNSADGVEISFDSSGHLIGGTTAGAGNVISGNGGNGIQLGGNPGPFGVTIQGNLIGTDAAGNASLGNSGHGILVRVAVQNTIGGAGAGAANRIAFNGGDGVSIVNPTGAVTFSMGNTVSRNSILFNSGLGIDLEDDGVTPNDGSSSPPDADSGANDRQNFPVLTSAVSSTRVIKGRLKSTPNHKFIIEFFSSALCDPSTFGEGDSFLGTKNVTTNGSGSVTFSATVSRSFPAGRSVTATATTTADPLGDTSEFSKCVHSR